MKIIQLLPSLSYGDAIGNDVLAIDKLIRQEGIESGIFAERIDKRLPEGTAHYVTEIPELTDDDVIIYHGAIGSILNQIFIGIKGRKVMIYHNITPPIFFEQYSKYSMNKCADGIEEIKSLSDVIDYCIADSEFNKMDLINMGFSCPIEVCPILVPFEDYETTPDQRVIDRYTSDRVTNLLFVGRIAPNKKQEDLIRAFYCYHKYFNSNSRLILCGSSGGMENYLLRLIDYSKALGVQDSVVFTGHVRFEELLAYYRVADAFLCMSEHEGFCVPLLEAMYFKVPIIAYNSTGIPYTLGGAGVLLDDKAPLVAAHAIEAVLNNDKHKKHIIAGQTKRLQVFSYSTVSARLKELFNSFLVNDSRE